MAKFPLFQKTSESDRQPSAEALALESVAAKVELASIKADSAVKKAEILVRNAEASAAKAEVMLKQVHQMLEQISRTVEQPVQESIVRNVEASMIPEISEPLPADPVPVSDSGIPIVAPFILKKG